MEAAEGAAQLLEEYDASNFAWASHVLITSRTAREQKLAELEAIAALGNLDSDDISGILHTYACFELDDTRNLLSMHVKLYPLITTSLTQSGYN